MDYTALLSVAFRAGRLDAAIGRPIDAWPNVATATALLDDDNARDVFLAWRAGWYAAKKSEVENA